MQIYPSWRCGRRPGWAGPGGAGRGRGRGGAGRAGPARRGGPAAAKYFVYMFLYMLVYSGYI